MVDKIMIAQFITWLGVTPTDDQMTVILALACIFGICVSYKALSLVSDIIASIFGVERG